MKISDEKLLIKIKSLVSLERSTHAELLEHLQEVQRRRLYADLGYSSMFKYLVKELKYSEGAAVRRINTLKLSKKIPAIKNLIKTGELSLAVASQAQYFSQNLSIKDTEKVIQKVKNRTKIEATTELLKMAQSGTPAVLPRDIKNPISEFDSRLHVNLKNDVIARLEKFKSIKKFSTEQALEHLLILGFYEINSDLEVSGNSSGTNGRSIPTKIKKLVIKRAQYCCEYPKCDEIRYLEFEHVIPFAKGGKHSVDNIKLFCKAHNQRAAIMAYGQSKMDFFIN